MVKSELLQKMCNLYPNVLRKDMEKILEIIFQEFVEALRRDENIEIRGFGIFKTTIRKARVGRNPKNSEIVQIPKKKAIKWKMSKIFFNRLNKNFTENKISANNQQVKRIILALDTANLEEALNITKKVKDKIFTVKLGLEFFNANGKQGIKNLMKLE